MHILELKYEILENKNSFDRFIQWTQQKRIMQVKDSQYKIFKMKHIEEKWGGTEKRFRDI